MGNHHFQEHACTQPIGSYQCGLPQPAPVRPRSYMIMPLTAYLFDNNSLLYSSHDTVSIDYDNAHNSLPTCLTIIVYCTVPMALYDNVPNIVYCTAPMALYDNVPNIVYCSVPMSLSLYDNAPYSLPVSQ